MKPETIAEWRKSAEECLSDGGNYCDEHAQVLALLDALEAMTREARLSREATERAVRRLERTRDKIAYLHDVYAVSPNEPRCCSDCAAVDISDELRGVLRDA